MESQNIYIGRAKATDSKNGYYVMGHEVEGGPMAEFPVVLEGLTASHLAGYLEGACVAGKGRVTNLINGIPDKLHYRLSGVVPHPLNRQSLNAILRAAGLIYDYPVEKVPTLT